MAPRALRILCAVLPGALALSAAPRPVTFHSTISSGDKRAPDALDEALSLLALERGPDAAAPDLAVLCVAQALEEDLESLADACFERTGARLLFAVVGAGVSGGGRESEGERRVSVAAGCLPPGCAAEPFVFARGEDGRFDERSFREERRELSRTRAAVLLLGDPSAPVAETLAAVQAWTPSTAVVGGITCPTSPSRASIAVREVGTAVPTPPESCLGIALSGDRLRAALESITGNR